MSSVYLRLVIICPPTKILPSGLSTNRNWTLRFMVSQSLFGLSICSALEDKSLSYPRSRKFLHFSSAPHGIHIWTKAMNSINHLVIVSLENFNFNGKSKGCFFVGLNSCNCICCFVTGEGNQIFISGGCISAGAILLSLLSLLRVG